MSTQHRRPRSVAWLRVFSVFTLVMPLLGAVAAGDPSFVSFLIYQLLFIGLSATQWVLAGVVEDLARTRDASRTTAI